MVATSLKSYRATRRAAALAAGLATTAGAAAVRDAPYALTKYGGASRTADRRWRDVVSMREAPGFRGDGYRARATVTAGNAAITLSYGTLADLAALDLTLADLAGMPVSIHRAGVAGAVHSTTISGTPSSGTSLSLAAAPATSATDAIVTFGHDDAAASQAFYDSLPPGVTLWYPQGWSRVSTALQFGRHGINVRMDGCVIPFGTYNDYLIKSELPFGGPGLDDFGEQMRNYLDLRVEGCWQARGVALGSHDRTRIKVRARTCYGTALRTSVLRELSITPYIHWCLRRSSEPLWDWTDYEFNSNIVDASNNVKVMGGSIGFSDHPTYLAVDSYRNVSNVATKGVNRRHKFLGTHVHYLDSADYAGDPYHLRSATAAGMAIQTAALVKLLQCQEITFHEANLRIPNSDGTIVQLGDGTYNPQCVTVDGGAVSNTTGTVIGFDLQGETKVGNAGQIRITPRTQVSIVGTPYQKASGTYFRKTPDCEYRNDSFADLAVAYLEPPAARGTMLVCCGVSGAGFGNGLAWLAFDVTPSAESMQYLGNAAAPASNVGAATGDQSASGAVTKLVVSAWSGRIQLKSKRGVTSSVSVTFMS